MAKVFLVVEPSCLKKRVLKPKYAITNVDWNNLTFEFLAKDEQNLLGTTSNYSRSSQGTTRNLRTFQGLDYDAGYTAGKSNLIGLGYPACLSDCKDSII